MWCINIACEKHIVFRARHFMRVLSVKFFRSIVCVLLLPTVCFSSAISFNQLTPHKARFQLQIKTKRHIRLMLNMPFNRDLIIFLLLIHINRCLFLCLPRMSLKISCRILRRRNPFFKKPIYRFWFYFRLLCSSVTGRERLYTRQKGF